MGTVKRADDQPDYIWADGTQDWRLNGVMLHREGDQPARIRPDGCIDGELHREGDQPARIWADGTQEWYLHGKLHREGDQPAIVFADGTRVWGVNGNWHREGDQPARIWPDGSQEWWYNDLLHRDGGMPASVCVDGMQRWYTHGVMIHVARVTDFCGASDRFALVRAVVAIGTAACVPHCDTDSAVGSLLQAVHGSRCGASSYHVTHEHAFLVALFL